MRKVIIFLWLTVGVMTAVGRTGEMSRPAGYMPLRKVSETRLVGAEVARCLLFDHHGMMWIGTEQGLLSYDGYRFRNYRSDAYSPGILPNNYVRCLTEGHDGALWIGTRDGVVRFDRQRGTFKTYHLAGENRRLINTLFTSSDGTIWVGTNGGICRFDPAGETFIYDEPLRDIMSFAEDRQGNIYVGTWEKGLFRLDRKTGKAVAYPSLNRRNTAYSMLADSRGRLWIGTWEHGIVRIDRPMEMDNLGIHTYNEGRGNFRTYYQLVEDSVSHAVWGCCLEGITRVDMDGGEPENIGGTYSFCNGIRTDGQGNLWVLTQNEGIVHLSAVQSPFSQWNLPTDGQQLPVDRINTVFTLDGRNFWLGLQPYGLALYDRQTRQVRYGSAIPGFAAMKGSDGVYLQTVRSMISVGDEVWMGSDKGVLTWRQGREARLLRSGELPYLGASPVNALLRQHDGVVWIGQNSQVGVAFSKESGQRLTMREDEDDFSYCNVCSMMEDSKGQVWIATENGGIIRVSGDARKPSSLRYHHYCPARNNYPIDDAIACYEDSRHRLWAISNSGGLFSYDSKADRFLPVNHRYHISGGSVYAIEEDERGCLWLSTEQSLVRLSFGEGETPDVTSYGREDGLTDIHFSQNASFRYGKELFFGSERGFFSFVPDRRLDDIGAKAPQLVVTDLLIDDRPIAHIDSLLRQRITSEIPVAVRRLAIPSQVRKFTVEFSLLTYINQQQNRYMYRLEGYDGEWHFIGSQQHSVTFQNLPSGSYRLRLRAADSYGHWRELPYAITIKVLPPWYRTWWAYLLYLVLLAAAVYGAIRWYKNYLKTKNRLAMAVIFTNITHELLTPLTVISASVDDMRQKAPQFSENYGLMQNNIRRLTRLLRQILEVRKSQAGQLRLLVARGDLAAFVRRECENIRPMVGGRKGQLSVDCPETLDAWYDKDKVDKIIYNLLSNAVKYNKENGKIAVSLAARDARTAVLTVSDEGIGMSKDKLKHLYTRFLDGDYRRMNTGGTGIGLSLTHDLVVLHHGKIDCRSKEGEGTTFTVMIPISKESYLEREIDFTADNPDADSVDLMNHLEDGMEAMTGHAALPAQDDGEEKDYSMLIVEDNAELLELMRKLFSQRYNVYIARNGQQALNVIYKRELDIVVTDVMMPVMDGIELTRTIKSSSDYGQLPVVMLTAKTRDEDKNIGYETGADAYITKPFKLGDLQLRIDSIIANRERIRRKFSSQTEFKVEEQHYSSPDELFIQKAVDCVKLHLDDGDYDREQFASDMCVSSSTLYNKLRALTGQNITGFINSIRLKEACRIARANPYISVNELSMQVGFNTPKYFSKCFKKEFGMLLKEYIQNSHATDIG